jgi:hypothetical protein
MRRLWLGGLRIEEPGRDSVQCTLDDCRKPRLLQWTKPCINAGSVYSTTSVVHNIDTTQSNGDSRPPRSAPLYHTRTTCLSILRNLNNDIEKHSFLQDQRFKSHDTTHTECENSYYPALPPAFSLVVASIPHRRWKERSRRHVPIISLAGLRPPSQ